MQLLMIKEELRLCVLVDYTNSAYTVVLDENDNIKAIYDVRNLHYKYEI